MLAAILAALAVIGIVVWNLLLKRQIALQTRELRTAQTRLLDAIESIPAAFVLYDSNERLLLCNGKFREIYGYSLEEAAIGVGYGDLYKLDVERGNMPVLGHRFGNTYRQALIRFPGSHR